MIAAFSRAISGMVGPGLGEPREHDRGQQLELGRLAVPLRHPIRDREHSLDVAGEILDADRMAIDDDALPIRHQVRLRRLPDAQPGRSKGATGEGQHAALAVRPGHERAACGQLRIAELAQQRSRPPKPEADPESTSGSQRRQRGVVIGRCRGRCRHSRVSSSS
jgi:hypothetical protein